MSYIKKNRVKILKGIISVVFVFFTLNSIANIVYMIENTKYFYVISLFYLWIAVFCNLVAEFSPYILYKYLVKVIPSLRSYIGRMCIYFIVGIFYLSPELNLDKVFDDLVPNNVNKTLIEDLTDLKNESKKINFSKFLLGDYFDFSLIIGIMMIILGVLCLLMHNVILTNRRLQENQILIMSKNYDDFSDENLNRDSLNYELISIEYKDRGKSKTSKNILQLKL